MTKFAIFKGARSVLVFLFAVGGPLLAHGQTRDGQSESVFNQEELARRVGQGKPSVGVILGMANADGTYDNGVNYGVEASFQFSVPYSAIVELSGYTATRSTTEPAITRTKLLGKVMYNFAGTVPVIRYSYAGAGIGPIYDSVGDVQKWNIGLAPQVGFDIPLGDTASNFSLGANVALLLVTGGSPSSASANGVAKYWF